MSRLAIYLLGPPRIERDGVLIKLDRRKAIDKGIHAAQEGDTILIAGRGHESFLKIKGASIPFDGVRTGCGDLLVEGCNKLSINIKYL